MSNVLVDTAALIWFADGSSRLSDRGRATIDDLSILQFASAASIWEMAIKISLGKLKLKNGDLHLFTRLLKENRFEMLPVTAEDALVVAGACPLANTRIRSTA